ncbi:ribose 5-phosphate isomerase B [Candidatus Woesearchaeota archaeon]|nr:ribose 5-phosphate isomerase B [Candidatus Woesearchaeota archaeon]
MIYLGSDHGGFKLKESIKSFLDNKNIKYEDMGTHNEESCDYPDIAKIVANQVAEKNALGILVCGTGIGMSIAANKIKGIRAALCHNEYTAEMARKHNDANILCLGGRVLQKDIALKIVDIFINTEFDGGRHKRRVDKIMEIQDGC